MKRKPVDISKCGMIGFCSDGDTLVYDRKKKRYEKGKHKFFDRMNRMVPVMYIRNSKMNIKFIKAIAASLLTIGLIVLFCYVLKHLDVENYVAVVVEKTYVPSTTSIERNYASGELYTSFRAERFILVIKQENGKINSIEVDSDQYGNAVVGEPIELQRTVFK